MLHISRITQDNLGVFLLHVNNKTEYFFLPCPLLRKRKSII